MENNKICAFCKEPLKRGFFHIHHILQKSKGGSDNKENLLYLCKDCHYVAHRKSLRHGLCKDNIEISMGGTDYFFIWHENCPKSDYPEKRSVMNIISIKSRQTKEELEKEGISPVFTVKCSKCGYLDAIKPYFTEFDLFFIKENGSK